MEQGILCSWELVMTPAPGQLNPVYILPLYLRKFADPAKYPLPPLIVYVHANHIQTNYPLFLRWDDSEKRCKILATLNSDANKNQSTIRTKTFDTKEQIPKAKLNIWLSKFKNHAIKRDGRVKGLLHVSFITRWREVQLQSAVSSIYDSDCSLCT
jgi:hypothetical protein